jgi:hypothetical protein
MIPNSHATSLLSCFFLLATLENATGGDEWPQFRGPDGQGHTSAVGLPTEWSETQNIAWKTGLPGEGHSSPVISGDQIWLTTAVTETLPEAEQQKRLATLKHLQGLNWRDHSLCRPCRSALQPAPSNSRSSCSKFQNRNPSTR